MKLTEAEERIVRFYEGDVEGTDPFWSDPKAYLTINSLFFDGLENEICRTDENKKLNPVFLDDFDRLLSVTSTLFRIGEKNAAECERHAFRVERYADYLAMKKCGQTISFTSTSTSEFLNAYRDKRGLALLKIVIREGVAAIDMQDVLSEYRKAEESEILLLPGTTLEISERELPQELRQITDMDGNPPKVYASVTACNVLFSAPYVPYDEEAARRGAEAGKRIYHSLNGHRPFRDAEDMESYVTFKKMFRSVLSEMLRNE